MTTCTQELYHFLFACGGNWRGTIHISCRSCTVHREGCEGYLLAADPEGRPVLMEVGRFCRLSGERIDPAECRGQLDRQAFEDIFGRYLLWALPSASPCPLRQLAPPD